MKRALRQQLESWQLCGVNEIFVKRKLPHQAVPIKQSFATKQDWLSYNQIAYKDCQKCPLWKGRVKFVYGEGDADATVMVIGEGPGEQENIQGRPFVGPAGQLLDKMLQAIMIEREDAYIANVVKCRPPNNRNPEQSERCTCLPYLKEQIEIIQPKIFLLMGLVAAHTLLETSLPMHTLRESVHTLYDRPAFVTYHPSSLLRNPNNKRPTWEDLQKFQIVYDEIRSKTKGKSNAAPITI